MVTVTDVNNALYDTFKSITTDNISCIVYVFDRSSEGGGAGFNTNNCDQGDAMVAIKRIAERYDIDLETLAEMI